MKNLGRSQIFAKLKTPAGRRAGVFIIFSLISFIFFLWSENILLASIIAACISIYINSALKSIEQARTRQASQAACRIFRIYDNNAQGRKDNKVYLPSVMVQVSTAARSSFKGYI